VRSYPRLVEYHFDEDRDWCLQRNQTRTQTYVLTRNLKFRNLESLIYISMNAAQLKNNINGLGERKVSRENEG
jgi:hypothetical protein